MKDFWSRPNHTNFTYCSWNVDAEDWDGNTYSLIPWPTKKDYFDFGFRLMLIEVQTNG